MTGEGRQGPERDQELSNLAGHQDFLVRFLKTQSMRPCSVSADSECSGGGAGKSVFLKTLFVRSSDVRMIVTGSEGSLSSCKHVGNMTRFKG